MNIYLIRHAKAVTQAEQHYEVDEDRPLTADGEVQARQLAETLHRRGVELDVVLTTPLLRARRTAEILLENWQGQPTPELVVENRIKPECGPRKLARVLRDVQKQNVAIVGHQPDIGDWAAWLIGSKKVCIDFAKGGAALIVWDEALKKGGGALQWLVTPRWFDEESSIGPRLVAGAH